MKGDLLLILSNCLLREQITASGPVRKYLACDPILRALLAGLESDEE